MIGAIPWRMDRVGSRQSGVVVVGRGLAARTSRRAAIDGQHNWSNPSCDDGRRADLLIF